MHARKRRSESAPSFQFSLHVRHPSIDPEALSRELDLRAEESIAAGAPRARGSSSSTPVHRETYWVAVLPQQITPARSARGMALFTASSHEEHSALVRLRRLEWGLLSALRTLWTRSAALRRLRADGAQVSFVATVDPAAVESFTLPPQIAKLLCELDMSIEFEFAR